MTIPEAVEGGTVILQFKDGLQGVGEAQTNIISFDVDSKPAALGSCAIKVSKAFSIPFDFNGNGDLDILDVIDYLDFSDPPRLPCEAKGTIHEPDNIASFDSNGDGELDLADAVHIIRYIFLDGKPHASGEDCQVLGDCPDACGKA